jgi:hypothetical protein
MAYVSELRSRPAVAALLGEAVITEQLRGTAALPTFPRMSSGPGWAIGGIGTRGCVLSADVCSPAPRPRGSPGCR